MMGQNDKPQTPLFYAFNLDDPVPDHSTFSRNRHGRFCDAEALRFVFERVLQSCIDAGLVGGEGFAVDASVVKADASRQRFRNNDDDRGSGPGVREYLDGLQEDDAVAPPKRVSPTDPQARLTAAPGGPGPGVPRHDAGACVCGAAHVCAAASLPGGTVGARVCG